MGGSFKSGAGTLDFEDSNDSDDSDESTNENESIPESDPASESTPDQESSDASETTVEDTQQNDGSSSATESASKYPYFVRRSSVGDERSNRMEVHVRDEVADHESEYLTDLADELDTDSVAKTDAREFALKLAHEQPEEVARLMREEGYGELS